MKRVVRFRKTVVYLGAVEVDVEVTASREAILAAARKAFAAKDERMKWDDSEETTERAYRVEDTEGKVVPP